MAQGVTAQATPRPLLRPIELGDLEALADLDARYARATGQSQVMDRASVHYYLRSGHSFVAERVQLGAAKPAGHSEGQAELDGFVLAHSTWSGRTAVVRVERVVVASEADPEAHTVASALTAAVVKSAYDAGVYRLVAAVAAGDRLAHGALEASGFTASQEVSYQRLLGAGALSGGGSPERAGVGGGEHDG